MRCNYRRAWFLQDWGEAARKIGSDVSAKPLVEASQCILPAGHEAWCGDDIPMHLIVNPWTNAVYAYESAPAAPPATERQP